MLTRVHGHTIDLAGIGPTARVLDLGANRGAFSKALRQLTGCQPLTVEASPLLIEPLRAAGLDVLHAAVGPTPGYTALHIDPVDSTRSHITSITTGSSDPVVVPAVSLAQLVDGHVDLVKFDIEGAEVDVLLEAPSSALQRISQISVEFHDFCGVTTRSQVMAVMDRLRNAGFCSIVITRHGHGDVWFGNTRLLRIGRRQYLRRRLLDRTLIQVPSGLRRLARRAVPALRPAAA